MPRITIDIVDAYVFRRSGSRIQFLLLRRSADGSMPGAWSAVHGRITPPETAFEAARRAVRTQTGLASHLIGYSADFIDQFYDPRSDAIVMAPSFAFELRAAAPVALDDEFDDFAWCDRDEATDRLMFNSHRWAVRHIEDLFGHPGNGGALYRID